MEIASLYRAGDVARSYDAKDNLVLSCALQRLYSISRTVGIRCCLMLPRAIEGRKERRVFGAEVLRVRETRGASEVIFFSSLRYIFCCFWGKWVGEEEGEKQFLGWK